MKSNFLNSLKKKKTILQPLLLRRHKNSMFNGKPILQLPSVERITKKIDLSEKEKIFYASVWKAAKSQFKKLLRENSSFANILTLLLRVRQACNHYYLVLTALRNQKVVELSELNRDFDEWCGTALQEVSQQDLDEMEEDGAPKKKSQTAEIEERNERTSAIFCFGCMSEVDEEYSIRGCIHKFCSSVSLKLFFFFSLFIFFFSLVVY